MMAGSLHNRHFLYFRKSITLHTWLYFHDMTYENLSPAQELSLTSIWERKNRPQIETTGTWEADLKQVYDLGLGMQELLQFLYGHQPDLPGFLQWVNEHCSTTAAGNDHEDPVLTPADLDFWKEHGYVVVKNVVTAPEHTAANKAIWEFLGADPEDPGSWYREHPARNGLMLVFTQHKALQAIRNSPRIRKAYEQLYSSTAIYKVIDKVSFNPPQNEHYRFAGSPLHWDTSLELPIPDRFQGLLYLSDVTASGGAFQCVPGFHRVIGQWIKDLPAGIDPRQHAIETLQPIPVPGNAGDFIIWHQALPHCASPNLDNRPRLVQYLTYIPEDSGDKRAWK